MDLSASPLTPRSKVKAALAAFDAENSDNDQHEAPACNKPRSALTEVSGNAAHDPRAHDSRKTTDPFADSDSDDDVPVKPRGRLAARLAQADEAENESAPRDSTSAGGNAYERIKKRLMQKNANEDQTEGNVEVSTTTTDKFSVVSPIVSASDAQAEMMGLHAIQESPSKQSDAFNGSATASAARSSPPHSPTSSPQSDQEDATLPEDPLGNSRFLELVAKKKAEREREEAEERRRREEKLAKRRELEEDASEESAVSSEDEHNRRLTQGDRPMRKASKKAIEEMNRETQRMSRNMQLAHQAKTKKKISKQSFLDRFNPQTSNAPSFKPSGASSSAPSSRPTSDVDDAQHRSSPLTSPMKPEESLDSKAKQNKDSASDQKIDRIDAMDIEADLPEPMDIFAAPLTAANETSTEMGDQHIPQPGRIRKEPRAFQKIRLPPVTHTGSAINLDSDSDLDVAPAKNVNKPTKSASRIASFQQRPSKTDADIRSLQRLRALAHLNSPERPSRAKKISLNLGDMQALLQNRARQQARKEKLARIEELKAKGVHISTTEEREEDQAALEDILERGRREAEEVRQEEKKAKQRQKLANGGTVDAELSSEEDEDYVNTDDDGGSAELSGSEDEEEDAVDDADGGDDEGSEGDGEGSRRKDQQGSSKATGLFDVEASESDQDEQDSVGPPIQEEEVVMAEADDGDDETDPLPVARKRRTKNAVIDDEDEEVEAISDVQAPASVAPSPHHNNLLDLPGNGFLDSNFGLTQVFAGTMANSQFGQGALDEDGGFPDLPPEPVIATLQHQDSIQMIADSQTDPAAQDSLDFQDTVGSGRVDLDFSQSQIHRASYWQSQDQFNTTQLSQIPDPTQDDAYEQVSPAIEGFVEPPPPSTVDTVPIVMPSRDVSPVKARGRLHRRAVVDDNDSSPEDIEAQENSLEAKKDAFATMKEKRRKVAAQAEFDKKKSEAKGMVEEQAQESEDEYAGLGGASDDESEGEEDEEVRKMLDHGEVDVDERALAAMHANAERERDEKEHQRIYKDLINGGLRRKRGHEFDLSDSEDEAEARRRRKQRENARIRKALMADENVGKIAEDPKKMPFFRAIEDRDNDEDMNFLDSPGDALSQMGDSQVVDGDSQSQQQQQQNGPSLANDHDSTPTTGNISRGPPLQEINPNMRPPANARRTPANPNAPSTRKPASIAEIRESVSFLTEAPGAVSIVDDDDDEDEGEDASAFNAAASGNNDDCDEDNDIDIDSQAEDKQTEIPFTRTHPRRTPAAVATVTGDNRSGRANTVIIDRLSLKRASSSSLSSTTSMSIVTTSRLAFANNSSTGAGGGMNGGFKVPSLLRRATTQLTNSNTTTNNSNDDSASATSSSSSSSVKAAVGNGSGSGFGATAIKQGGSKKCSVNYHITSRDGDKKRALDAVEKRRRLERERKAIERRCAGGGGLRGLMMMPSAGGSASGSGGLSRSASGDWE